MLLTRLISEQNIEKAPEVEAVLWRHVHQQFFHVRLTALQEHLKLLLTITFQQLKTNRHNEEQFITKINTFKIALR